MTHDERHAGDGDAQVVGERTSRGVGRAATLRGFADRDRILAGREFGDRRAVRSGMDADGDAFHRFHRLRRTFHAGGNTDEMMMSRTIGMMYRSMPGMAAPSQYPKNVTPTPQMNAPSRL